MNFGENHMRRVATHQKSFPILINHELMHDIKFGVYFKLAK
jgi:hypothetical protein